jgi:hypothetical protein
VWGGLGWKERVYTQAEHSPSRVGESLPEGSDPKGGLKEEYLVDTPHAPILWNLPGP